MCKSHGASSKRCEIEDCFKVAVSNNMCSKHNKALSEVNEDAPVQSKHSSPHASSQGGPFSPSSASVSAQVPPAAAAAYHNSSTNAQNNYAAQSKLSQVIEEHNRHNAEASGIEMSHGLYAHTSAAVSGLGYLGLGMYPGYPAYMHVPYSSRMGSNEEVEEGNESYRLRAAEMYQNMSYPRYFYG